MPVKCHIGDAVVVNKRPSNDEAVEKLVRMEKYVHFAREESLRDPECVEERPCDVEEAHEDEPA